MELRWTGKALSDLTRLYDFLAAVNRPAAVRTLRALTAAPLRLRGHPRLGEQLDEFAPREVRRLIVGQYELRYEVRDSTVFILRLWHSREDR